MSGVGPGGQPLLEIGRVARPHGLKGDVVVELVTDRTERLAPGAVLEAGGVELTVAGSRRLGSRAPTAGHETYLVRFGGVGSRDDAERLRGLVLRAAPLAVPGTLWIHELVGVEVVTTAGEHVGRVEAVEANPASDLLVLTGGALVPLRFVVRHRPGEVTVDVPEGLFE